MKIILFPLTILTFILGFSIRYLNPVENTPVAPDIPVCGQAVGSEIVPGADGKFVAALPGWGKYSYKISTSIDSSQFFFDQGLNLYYSYHFREAVASFKESARFDPANAMAYWGQALAMGPYYNAAHSYKKPAEIGSVLEAMNRNSANASAREKDLIAVMNTRYSADPTDADRALLNTAYSKNLKTLLGKHRDDDITMLYIDSQMLIHAWDFWNTDGTPKTWTAELIRLCEQVLKSSPKHPAALHYYIHLTEASRSPQVALASAEALRDLLPGVAHMVHMSSHEYERNGLYGKGAEVNNMADNNLLLYDSMAPHLALNKHSSHYFAVQTYCALTGGMYTDAIRYAERCRKVVAPSYENIYDQYLFMLPVMVRVRMGKWEEILQDTTQIDPKWTYAGLLSDFAKGLAYANTSQPDSARARLEGLQTKINDPVLTKRRIPFNAPVQIAKVAENILLGVIFFNKDQKSAAFRSFENAVVLEDKLIYTEPKDWPLPSRQFLGAYLLKVKNGEKAEKVYRQDLAKNPANGWSLLGLYQSLSAQGQPAEAVSYEMKVKQAFAQATQLPPASVY